MFWLDLLSINHIVFSFLKSSSSFCHYHYLNYCRPSGVRGDHCVIFLPLQINAIVSLIVLYAVRHRFPHFRSFWLQFLLLTYDSSSRGLWPGYQDRSLSVTLCAVRAGRSSTAQIRIWGPDLMFCLELSQPWRVRELRARSDRILQVGAAGREKVWVGFFLYDSSEDLYRLWRLVRRHVQRDQTALVRWLWWPLDCKGQHWGPYWACHHIRQRVQSTKAHQSNAPKKPNYSRNAATPPPSPWCLLSRDPSK